MIRNVKIITDFLAYHRSPTEFADLATKANEKKMVLNHFAAALKIIKNVSLREIKEFNGQIHFANDGNKFFARW